LDCTLRPEESVQAIGLNLLCDHRVSEARAAHFFDATGRPGTVDELRKALLDYHWDWVCQQPAESYLSRPRNGHNFVQKSRLPKDLTLVNVLNVSAWVNTLRTLPVLGPRLETGFRRLADPLATADEIEAFLTGLFEAINLHRDERPVWVARWKEFERSVEHASTSTWNTAVGVWRRPGSWQIVLRYPITAVARLIRPTQLDSSSQYHFPSPPSPRPTPGGFTMTLREMATKTPIVPEWVHPPVDLRIEYWVAGGRLCAEVPDDGPADLWLYRSQHREKLARRFPKETAGWLPGR
jgi:hypothetical protein